LGVTLHAVARAGAAFGRKALVTGSGPIGVLVADSARLAGAAEIAVTDLYDEALAIASRMGASTGNGSGSSSFTVESNNPELHHRSLFA
jgi:threonine dehydrogenase-like Zn-dependent dehydrogenase